MNKDNNKQQQSELNYNNSYNELFIIQKSIDAKIKSKKIIAYIFLHVALFTIVFGAIAISPEFALKYSSVLTTIAIVLSQLIIHLAEFFVLKFSKKVKLLIKQQNELLDKLNTHNIVEGLNETTSLSEAQQPQQLHENETSYYDNLLSNENSKNDNSLNLTKNTNKVVIPKIIKVKRVAMLSLLIIFLFITLNGMVLAISEQYSIGLPLLILGSFGMFYALVAYITTKLIKSLLYPFLITLVLLVLPISTYVLTEKVNVTVNAISTILATALGITLFGIIIYNTYTKPRKEFTAFVRDTQSLLKFISFPNNAKNSVVVFNKKQDRATIFYTNDYKIKIILEKSTLNNNNELKYEKLEEQLFEVHNSQKAEYFAAKKLIELYNLNDNRTIIDFINYDENSSISRQKVTELFELLNQNPVISNKITLQEYYDYFESGLITITFNELLTIAISHNNGSWFVMVYDYSFSNNSKENILQYINELIEEKYFFTQSKNGKNLNVHSILELKKILNSKQKKYKLVFSANKVYRK